MGHRKFERQDNKLVLNCPTPKKDQSFQDALFQKLQAKLASRDRVAGVKRDRDTEKTGSTLCGHRKEKRIKMDVKRISASFDLITRVFL